MSEQKLKRAEGHMDTLPIALQLYTVRDETQRDFVGTVRSVGQMGYQGVEFAGYGNLTSQEIAALLAETGLRAVSTHLGLQALQGSQLEASIRYSQDIHCPTIVLPSLPHAMRNRESIQELAPQLNAIGQRCQEQGMRFAYHNHDFEFARVEGRTLLDYLLEATDPALVKLELDVYWAAYAGVDPVDYLHTLGERVVLLHLKDMATDRSMTEVGKGTLDMQQLCAFAHVHGLWGIVEQDYPRIPALESARISLEYFQEHTKAARHDQM